MWRRSACGRRHLSENFPVLLGETNETGELGGAGSQLLRGPQILQSGHIQSMGFATGVSGWRVNAAGDAEFNDITIRGDFYGNWNGTTPVDLSTTFDAGATTGFAFDSSAGAAQLMGDVWLGGDITLIGSGVIATD